MVPLPEIDEIVQSAPSVQVEPEPNVTLTVPMDEDMVEEFLWEVILPLV